MDEAHYYIQHMHKRVALFDGSSFLQQQLNDIRDVLIDCAIAALDNDANQLQRSTRVTLELGVIFNGFLGNLGYA